MSHTAISQKTQIIDHKFVARSGSPSESPKKKGFPVQNRRSSLNYTQNFVNNNSKVNFNRPNEVTIDIREENFHELTL